MKSRKFIAIGPQSNHPHYLQDYLEVTDEDGVVSERASEKTTIDGWEKKHYIPDTYVDFVEDQDFTVYTAPNDEFVVTIGRRRDEVTIQFVMDEDSKIHPNNDHFDSSEWKRYTAIISDLKDIEADVYAPIIAVSKLPDMSTLSSDAYYLLSQDSGLTLFYVDTRELNWVQVKPKQEDDYFPFDPIPVEAFESNLNLLLAAVSEASSTKVSEIMPKIVEQMKKGVPTIRWDRRSLSVDQTDPNGLYNTKIRFKCETKALHKIAASLDVLKRHCSLPEAVIADIKQLVNVHNARFVGFRQWLAEKLYEDPKEMVRQLNAVLDQADRGTSIREYFFSLIKWYAGHNNAHIAIILQKALPISDREGNCYIEATRYIKDLMMKNENVLPDRREYFERLSEMSLELANVTEDKSDFQFAMRIVSQLCGGNGFEPDLEVDHKRLYVNLLVKYASQVGELKEEIKALKDEIKTLKKPVAAPVLVAAPRIANPAPVAASSGRPRSKSV